VQVVIDCADKAERLRGLGAPLVAEHGEMGIVRAVMTDPEGNEFCA
jgi:predicted enzyme related to lactoylglutathione lyase